MRVLFAGGGTGGHLYPALAVAECLTGADQLHFVGSARGMEERIVRAAGIGYTGLAVEGFHRGWNARNLLFPVRLASALVAARGLIRQFRPEVVLGTGGFASGAPVVAAQFAGVPTVLQEQNAFPGVTTRLLARRAREIHVAYDEATAFLPAAVRSRVRLTGNPVRHSLLDELQQAGGGDAVRQQARARFKGLHALHSTLLVIGGSQGSRILNRAVLAWLERRQQVAASGPLQLIWAAGEKLYAEVEPALRSLLAAAPAPVPTVVLRPYLDDMAGAYAAADLVLCRAGASTCAELALVGRPAVLVPFAAAAGDHQTHNAAAVTRAGAARMISEKQLASGESAARALAQEVEPLLADAVALARLAAAMKTLAKPDAATEIAACLRRLATSHGETA
jgi:UDP-N-acetylglucosamine--N-acetylmuramyl-(pentapeptide) pyrophosphoryl-undecaprenol N-acetylglucosamine transferase